MQKGALYMGKVPHYSVRRVTPLVVPSPERSRRRLSARGGDAKAGGAPAVPTGRPQPGEDPVAEPGVDALADTAKVGQAVHVRRRATKDDDAVSRMLWEGCPN